ncbi:MAG: DUF371 domain-containing protein [Thermoproteota archaeon]
MRLVEYVHGKGHPNIRATHPTTLATTREPEVSRAGDCFIMVSADKAPLTLSEAFKNAARSHVKILVRIIVEDLEDQFECYGEPTLSFKDECTMIFRKSSYICGKTVGVKSSKSAMDVSRSIVSRLRRGSEITMELTVNP